MSNKTHDEVIEECRVASGDGPWFIHYINPHDSAEHHDCVMEKRDWTYCKDGIIFGIWRHREPAITPWLYDFCSQHLEAAIDTKQKLDTKFPNGFSE